MKAAQSIDLFFMVKGFYDKKEQAAKIDQEFEEAKTDFYAYMDDAMFATKKKLTVESVAEAYEVTRVINTKTTYDYDVAKEILSPEVLQNVSDVKAEVIDYDKLVAFCKENNIALEKLSEFIAFNRQINASKLKQAADLGEVTPDEKEAIETKLETGTYYKVKKLK